MADEKIIFSMNGVGKVLPHNNRVILKDIYLSFFYGAKIGIIGLNGSGKSTLLKIIAGVEKSYRGEVVWAPGYSVGYLEQEPKMDPEKTVQEVVEEGVAEVMHLLERYNEVCAKLGEITDDTQMYALFDEQAQLTEKIDALDGWEIESKLERAMDALQCPPSDALVKNLSGGERRRVALCRLLLQQPDVLLLDEPTNHLDLFTMEELEKLLAGYGGTLLFVSHDEEFIRKTATRILCFEDGSLKTFEGGWEEMKAPRKKDTAEEDRKIAVTKLEMQMATISARLSSPKKGDRPDLLQEEYMRLAEELRELKNLSGS